MFHSGELRIRPRVALPGCLAVATLALAACGASPAASPAKPAASSAPVPAGLQRFYHQKLHWQPCPWQGAIAVGSATSKAEAKKTVAGFQCTQLTVPLNYSRPGGTTIKLAINRLPATSTAHRIGPLITNPGGPGASGVQFAFGAKSFFTPALRARYDIVGMDPRGVALSSPVECKFASQQALVKSQQPTLAGGAKFARACAKTSGKILPYVGTTNAARDLDIARAALGAPKLDYYGGSYGTLLGQVYLQMFPHNAGRVVLDSVESPAGIGDPTTQVRSFETTLRVMAQTCVQHGNCPMGSSASQVLARFDKLLTTLSGRKSPLLSPTAVEGAVADAAYSEADWPDVYVALGTAFRGSDTALGRFVHRDQEQKQRERAPLSDPREIPGSQTAIECLTLPKDQRSAAAARQATRAAQKAAPHFWTSTASLWFQCATWPVPSPPGAGRPIRVAGLPTVLLVNNTSDPATPLSWARTVHADLANSVLVTNQAGGHGFYKVGGACVHRVVDDFLISGTRPAAGTACHDRNPAVAPATGHR